MAKSGEFHEDFTRDDEVKRGSDRTFGLTVGGILAFVGGARACFVGLTATNVVLLGLTVRDAVERDASRKTQILGPRLPRERSGHSRHRFLDHCLDRGGEIHVVLSQGFVRRSGGPPNKSSNLPFVTVSPMQ